MSAEQLITKHLDIWTSAYKTRSSAGRGSSSKLDLYGIKKLRELILELAVRGKLVPQNPHDEPASELLKKIAAFKQNQIKEKKIKKTKMIEDVESESDLFDLPSSWGWAYLNELGDWGAGATPSRANSAYYGGDIPWFKSGELNEDFISHSEESVTELALKDCSLRQNQVGDVLIAMYGATIGKSSILSIAATTNQAVCACTPFEGVFNRFLLLLLRAFKSRFIGMGAGGAQPNISKEKIVATAVPVPPLAEQRRVVAKVDELMAFCDQLEQAQTDNIAAHAQLVEALLATLTNSKDHQELQANWQRIAEHFDTLFTTEDSIDQLKQTILQLAVMGKLVPQDPNDEPASELLKKIAAEKAQLIKEGKINKEKPLPEITDEEKSFELPLGWYWTKLGELALFQKGYAFKSEDYLNSGQMITKIQNLTENSIDNAVYIDSARSLEFAQYLILEGDIVMTTVGSWFSAPLSAVGRSFLINKVFHNSLLNQNAVRIRFWQDLAPIYILTYLKSSVFKSYLINEAQGTANQASITQESIKNFVVCIPPKNEQDRIVAKVDELMALCDTIKQGLQNAQNTQLTLVDALIEQVVS